MKLLFFVFFLTVSNSIYADIIKNSDGTYSAVGDQTDRRTPLEKYRGDSVFWQLTCSLKFKLFQIQTPNGPASDDTDYFGCIDEAKKVNQANYKKINAKLKSNKAKATLKEYQLALILGLDGINPNIDEMQILYNQRQSKLKEKADEAWARFEMEK